MLPAFMAGAWAGEQKDIGERFWRAVIIAWFVGFMVVAGIEEAGG